MTKWILIFLAACSGGSSKPAAAPVSPDPVPMPAPKPDPIAEPTKPDPTPTPTEPPKPDPAKVKADLLAAETTAFEKAKPVFEKHCARCHTKGGKSAGAKKLDHFDMTTYPFGGHHAMEISKEIRKTLGLSGKSATMPADKKGAVQGDELEQIKLWADAFDASHAGGAHEGHGGHGGHKH